MSLSKSQSVDRNTLLNHTGGFVQMGCGAIDRDVLIGALCELREHMQDEMDSETLLGLMETGSTVLSQHKDIVNTYQKTKDRTPEITLSGYTRAAAGYMSWKMKLAEAVILAGFGFDNLTSIIGRVPKRLIIETSLNMNLLPNALVAGVAAYIKEDSMKWDAETTAYFRELGNDAYEMGENPLFNDEYVSKLDDNDTDCGD